ncbi:hypothetical protein QUB05_13605 [Microcoleus sp. F10-C6]
MTVTFGEFEGVSRCFSVDGAKHLVSSTGSGSSNPSSHEFLGMVLLLSD